MADGTVVVNASGTLAGVGIKDRLTPTYARISEARISGSGSGTPMGPKVYKGDVGTFFCLYTGMVLDAGVTTLEVQKPDGAEVSWSGEVLDVMTFKYIIQVGDLDQMGIYKMQLLIDAPEIQLYAHSATVEIEVFDFWT